MRLFLFSTALLLTAPGYAFDPAAGQALHEANCLRCHDSGVYTRDERRVTSAAGLHQQVRRCEQMLGLRWFDEDIGDVTAYLNENFYHFE